jgi:hypothetical protein
MENRKVFWVIFLLGVAALVGLFMGISSITPESVTKINSTIPLPLLTIIIAFVDSFNPCNLFAFLLLLGVLTQTSNTKTRIYLIGFIFITVVYAFYFLVMAAWLNIFKFIGFINPLRIGIGILAIIAGIINCKELFLFGKGTSLMIPQQQKEKLYEKMRHMREIIAHGTLPLLILTTIALAGFTSFIELLCTSGFPVIYTSILSTKYAAHSLFHYYYLALYNLIYVIPLLIIIGAIGVFIKSKQLTKKQTEIIEFASGIIMIVLGIILLVRPELVI